MVSKFFKNRRVYLLTSVAYMGSLLFGYDTGVMGSVLALEAFKKDFGLPTDSSGFSDSKNASVSSNVVSLLTAGCFFGAIGAAWFNERYGRRLSLMGFSLVFLVGAALQTAAHHEIGMIYAGRVIAGLGIGGMSAITPVFVAENAPPALRGRIAGLFQEFLVIGSTFAYWLDYGVALHMPVSTKQWRVPVSIQLIPGGFMLIGLFFLKESPRWLMSKGRQEEAAESLAFIRCETHDSPFTSISAGKSVFFPATDTVSSLLLCSCSQIFQTIGVSASNASLFATGIYGTVKVITTGIFLIFGIDFIGRKYSLMGGAAWMAAMMFIIGAVLATYPPNPDSGSVSSPSIAMVAMIYLYVIGYSASWGPVPWVYLSEIFPTRLRSYGVGMGSATQWLFNFVITKITPEVRTPDIGWKTFLMFGIFCVCMGIFATFFIKETKGKTLEEIDLLFGDVTAEQRLRDVEAGMKEEQRKHSVKYMEDATELENRAGKE